MASLRRKQHRRCAFSTMLGHAYGHTYRTTVRTTGRARPEPAPPEQAPDTRRQAEIEHELSLARDIQQGLLLEAVPRLPGWEISAVSLPARDLGGDLYDFLPLGEGVHGLMIGDVSGKGLPAALRMAVARTVFRHEARRGATPGSTLAGVNRGIISEIPQGMITMLYATLDTRSGSIRLANAGHNYPVLINGHVDEIEVTGLPLGVDGDSEYEEISACVAPGETVLLYTDGIVEATDQREEFFGFERFEELLATHSLLKPRAMMATVLHELRTWGGGSQVDDITIVVIRRRLAELGAELRTIADDVLGGERTAQLWQAIARPEPDAGTEEWGNQIGAIVAYTQEQFGRGPARELNRQLRLALEEYR
jgi:sigma-B regulation protein RsbU (phosphoserine phosphatase)